MKVYLRTNTAGNNITITQNSNNLPTDSNNPLTIIDTASTTTNELKTTQYEVCADNNLANGDYNITIAYVLQDNLPIPMQTFTSADCQARPVYDAANPDPASTMTMIDTRNDQLYLARKLKDNKCWMIDNLKLELTDGMVLTPGDTDVSTDTTVDFDWDSFIYGSAAHSGNFTTGGYLTKRGGGGPLPDSQDAWRQIDKSNANHCLKNTGAYNWGNGSKAYNSNSKTGCGYFYNFYTATAGTLPETGTKTYYNAPGSMCPSGWKLPTGIVIDGIDSDFGTLDIAYPPGTGFSHYDLDTQGLWLSSGAWQGTFGSINFGTEAREGGYWSASIGGGDNLDQARQLFIDSGYNNAVVLPGFYYSFSAFGRGDGLAVRCLVS
jgi:hypothetical protein